MSNKKVNMTNTKKDILDAVNEQSALLEEKDKKLEEQSKAQADMLAQMEQMKMMLMQLQSEKINSTPSTHTTDEEEFEVISYNIGRNYYNQDKDTKTTFYDFGWVESLTQQEVKSLIKFKKNKKLFTSGLLAFTNDEDYNKFKIKKPQIINDDFIIDLFKMNENDFKNTLDRVTDSKRTSGVIHVIIYRASYLYSNGKLDVSNRNTMESFKDYFGISLFDVVPYNEVM